MNCRHTRSQLVHLIEGELEEATAHRVQAHLEDCPDCRREHDILQASLTLLEEGTPVPELDPNFRAELRRRMLALHGVENTPFFLTKRGVHTIAKVFGPPLLGVLTSLLSVLPIYLKSPSRHVSPLGLLLSGVIWCGLYNALFFAIDRQRLDEALGRDPEEAIHLRTILGGTCASLAIVAAGTLFLIYRRRFFASLLLPTFWANPAGFFVYLSVAAILLTSLWVGRTLPVNPLGNTFLICGIYCLLLFPSFFISAQAHVAFRTVILAVVAIFSSGWVGCFAGVLMARFLDKEFVPGGLGSESQH